MKTSKQRISKKLHLFKKKKFYWLKIPGEFKTPNLASLECDHAKLVDKFIELKNDSKKEEEKNNMKDFGY